MASDTIARTQSRIVRSPERIKRTIVTMGSTAIEDKRNLAMNEAKIRDLQAKITALLNIEKVRTIIVGKHCDAHECVYFRTFAPASSNSKLSRKRLYCSTRLKKSSQILKIIWTIRRLKATNSK